VLVSYRIHGGSDTSRQAPTGALVADVRRAIELSAKYLPAADAPRLVRQARR
jgi:hypothetical protein